MTYIAPGRGAVHFLAFLDQLVAHWLGEVILILVNLASHKNVGYVVMGVSSSSGSVSFSTPYALWLNPIEPWWKTLRSLALKRRRFEDADDLTAAISVATRYWNEHRKSYIWRKMLS